MDYLIGLDIGTSSVKGVLMTTDGKVVHSAKGMFTYYTVGEGGVESLPDEYLSTCFQTLKELAGAAENGQIKGVCASSASGNTLLLDKENKPITNIISWQDKRVTDEARELLADLDADEFYRQIGWPFGYRAFPLPQLCYIKKHEPELMDRCSMVAMSTEYLYYTLTGEWGISTSAGATYFMIDQQTGEYMDWLLEKVGINKSMLPPVMRSGEVVGYIKKEMEEECGIPAGTPVVLGTFDHPSAARGAGILQEGEMLLSCGTSWVAFFPVKDREKGLRARMLVDPFLTPDGCYGVMSSIPSLSGRLKLYTNRYIDNSNKAFDKLSELAKQSQSGANGLCINPLEEPNDQLITSYSKADIARAIMEGTVTILKERLDTLTEHGVVAHTAVMVGGPSEDPYWRTLIEEMCGIPVRVVHASFAGAVGAAVIAGVGAGEYKDEVAAHQRFQESERG